MTFTADDVMMEIARRGSPPHWIAAAAGVSRRALESAIDGDFAELGAVGLGKLGQVLGLGDRVLEVPAEAHDEHLVARARQVVEADQRPEVHDGDAPWVAAARRAGVDVEAAYGVAAGDARAAAPPVDAKVLEGARRVVAADEQARVHDPDAPWIQAARRAGVDVEAAYSVGGGR